MLGGSFDPPHQGHIHITDFALKLFGLDEVWWIISPGNPLKNEKPASYSERGIKAHSILRNPKVKVSDFEYIHGIIHTCETIRMLKKNHRNHRFIWLMGSDNLIQINLWKRWNWIFENIPIVVLSRSNCDLPGLTSKAANAYSKNYLPSRMAGNITLVDPPVWTLIKIPKINISSSQYREKGLWKINN